MAKCGHCCQEMLEADSCIKVPVTISPSENYDPIPFGTASMGYTDGKADELTDRCPDCNVAVGGYHHPGCDWEVCPKCNGQLISCGCIEQT